jgi:hypothetical protein
LSANSTLFRFAAFYAVLRAWRLFDNGLFAGAHAMLADFKRGKNTARSFAPEELVAKAEKVVAARE